MLSATRASHSLGFLRGSDTNAATPRLPLLFACALLADLPNPEFSSCHKYGHPYFNGRSSRTGTNGCSRTAWPARRILAYDSTSFAVGDGWLLISDDADTNKDRAGESKFKGVVGIRSSVCASTAITCLTYIALHVRQILGVVRTKSLQVRSCRKAFGNESLVSTRAGARVLGPLRSERRELALHQSHCCPVR
jgi:hypothetical protein